MIASVVEGKELIETVVYSVIAGVGVTLIFAIAIWGSTRFADLNRDDRHAAATAAAALAVVAFLATIAAVVIGIVVMTKK